MVHVPCVFFCAGFYLFLLCFYLYCVLLFCLCLSCTSCTILILNKLVERLIQTVKKTLAHVCRLHPKQWHKMIPLVLWSIRESINQTLGTSPFMMGMGRNPSNPLSLIKDTWTGIDPVTLPAGNRKTVTEYLTDLQAKLKEIHDLAEQHTKQEQQRYVDHYNKTAVDKHFTVGQQVIVLIPDSTKKMISRWQGPGPL